MRTRPVFLDELLEDNALRSQPSRLRPHLPAVLIFSAFSVLLSWPLVLHIRDTLASWGDPVFQTWTIAWNWHALTTDPLAIFDANVFYPWRNVLAYSDHLFGQTLLVLPVMLFTDNAILADNISFLLAFIFSALAMYFLVYDLTGNRGAAILAGTAFAFAPSRMAHFEHLHILSAQWLPLALLCLRRTTISTGATRRWWAVGLGATFFAQGLFGIYFFYFLIVMLIIAGGVYLIFAAIDRDREIFYALALSIGACAIGGALLIPVLWPYQQVHDDLGIERGEEEVNFWSAKRSDYLAAPPVNDIYGDLFNRWHRDFERDLFPGLIILGLASIGAFNRRFRRFRWVLIGVTVGSVALSFGLSGCVLGHKVPLPYRIFYELLPGFRAIRVPARFGHLALVGLGGLAGLGVDLLWRRRSRILPDQATRIAGIGLVSFGLVLIAAETATSLPLPDSLPVDNPRADYQYVAEHPGPIIELPMGDGPVASAWPNFWSTKHWAQVANGFSGLQPPNYDLLRKRSKQFPSTDTIQIFEGIGIKHVLVHTDISSDERAALEAQLATYPEIQLVLPGPDAVYDLPSNPWMWRFADALPSGATVDLPDISSDPLVYGFIIAILQRTGHDVSGNGSIDYFELNPPDTPACYAILDQTLDPADHGYANATPLLSEAGYTLYHGGGCE